MGQTGTDNELLKFFSLIEPRYLFIFILVVGRWLWHWFLDLSINLIDGIYNFEDYEKQTYIDVNGTSFHTRF